MEGGGEIEGRGKSGRAGCFQRSCELLAGAAHRGNGVGVLATSEQHTLLREAVEVDDTACVLLDDFEAVATVGTAAEFGRSGERGVGEDENSGRGWLVDACAIEQTASVVGDGGLKDSRQGC